MTLFMLIFMAIATWSGIYNAVVAYREDNREAAIAWTAAAFFALGGFFTHLSSFLKSST